MVMFLPVVDIVSTSRVAGGRHRFVEILPPSAGGCVITFCDIHVSTRFAQQGSLNSKSETVVLLPVFRPDKTRLAKPAPSRSLDKACLA
jgi:hypothetical protein